jgi:hypothetical protein
MAAQPPLAALIDMHGARDGGRRGGKEEDRIGEGR